jgi:hypothetical protein
MQGLTNLAEFVLQHPIDTQIVTFFVRTMTWEPRHGLEMEEKTVWEEVKLWGKQG